MKELLSHIFDNFIYSNSPRKHFKKYYSEIKNYEPCDLLIYVIKNFNTHETISMLLNLPELWIDSNTEFWLNIFRKNSPREQDDRVSYYDNAKYDDIKFLSVYIGVNPFIVYFNDEWILNEDKYNTAINCLKFVNFIIPDRKRAIFYQNGYANKGKINHCVYLRNKLIDESVFVKNTFIERDFIDLFVLEKEKRYNSFIF